MKRFSKNNFYIIIFLTTLAWLTPPYLASAVGYTSDVLPSTIRTTSLADFILSLYTWGMWAVGFLVFIQLVRAGVMYMYSGVVDEKSKAKGIMQDAMIGLALALSSFLVVNTINPNLISIEPFDQLGVCLTSSQLADRQASGFTCSVDHNLIDCSGITGTDAYECSKP